MERRARFATYLLPYHTKDLGSVISSNNVEGDSSTNSSLSSFVREPEGVSMMRLSTPSFTKIQQGSATESQNNLLTNITLTIALLIQSISTTFLAVLWPLLSKDLFSLSAHKFGIITFISSIVSTGAMASFPIVERMDRVGGRVNCAALGFGVGAVLCFLFCYCSFGGGGIVYGGLEVMDLAVGSIDGGLVKEVSGVIVDFWKTEMRCRSMVGTTINNNFFYQKTNGFRMLSK
jgi:hypothetical protein